MALAQVLKKLTWANIRACAVSNDEAYKISDTMAKLQESLAKVGYPPG